MSKDELKKIIFEYLNQNINEAFVLSEIQSNIFEMQEISLQRIAVLMRELVQSNLIKKKIKNGRTVFYIEENRPMAMTADLIYSLMDDLKCLAASALKNVPEHELKEPKQVIIDRYTKRTFTCLTENWEKALKREWVIQGR